MLGTFSLGLGHVGGHPPEYDCVGLDLRRRFEPVGGGHLHLEQVLGLVRDLDEDLVQFFVQLGEGKLLDFILVLLGQLNVVFFFLLVLIFVLRIFLFIFLYF